jgi:glycerophosphoryl diester phosphodiesterase
MDRPFLNQGHRGARGLRPENTLPSFEAALDAGASSLETDVHLTSDGVPVLTHDPILDERIYRLAGQPPWSLPRPYDRPPVRRLTFADTRYFVADRNPDPNRFREQTPVPTPLAAWWQGQPSHEFQHVYGIPALAELYAFVAAYAGEPGRNAGKTDAQRANAAGVVLDVELKRVPFWEATSGRMEEKVLDVIRRADAVGRTYVRSFDHRCVQKLCELEPGLTGVVLMEGTTPIDPAALVRSAGGRAYGPDHLFLDEAQVRQCRAAGIPVIAWTVNDPDDWARLVGWGVDGITTDYPDRLTTWLASRER